MAGTGIKGWTGTTSTGKSVVNGIVQGGGSPAAAAPSRNEVVQAQNVANYLSTSGTLGANDMRDSLLGYSRANSAFNAREAAKARAWSADQNALAMATSAAEAQKNRDWQERLSNTAHQREVKDLIAAGLNPVLSANAGATTPAGSAGQGYTSSASSASADSSASSLASIFSQMLASARDLTMQDRALEFDRERLSVERYLSELSSSVGLESSLNALQGSLAIAGSTLGAAELSSSAQVYGHNIGLQKAREDIANQQFMQGQSIAHKTRENALERENKVKLANIDALARRDTSLIGTYNNVLNNIAGSIGKDSGTGFVGESVGKGVRDLKNSWNSFAQNFVRNSSKKK